MTNYNTASRIKMKFQFDIFAANGSDADTKAKNYLTQLFGKPAASLFKLTSASSSVLSGQLVSGSNYTYIWDLDIPSGKATATDPSDIFYVSLQAGSPTEALNALTAEAARTTNIPNTPTSVQYLQ